MRHYRARSTEERRRRIRRRKKKKNAKSRFFYFARCLRKLALYRSTEGMREAVSDLAGCPLSDWAWLKSSLPSSLGGLNIRHATLYAPAAFIGSIHQSESLISDILGHPTKAPLHLPNAINALARVVARPDSIFAESIDVSLRSYSLSHSVDEACFSLLLESSPDVRYRALALSSALPHAGDWLNVVPSSALGLHLMDCEFRLCLRYWLGLQMFQDGAQCPVCHTVADPYGDHHVGCGGNADRIARHNALRDAIFSAAQSAALAPRREVSSLISCSLSRPADVYLPSWKGSSSLRCNCYIDHATSYHPRGCYLPRSCSFGWRGKKIGGPCGCLSSCGSLLHSYSCGDPRGNECLICQHFGLPWSPPGSTFGDPPADSTRHLFQRCAISLWRGNAALWIRRIPTLAPSVDGSVNLFIFSLVCICVSVWFALVCFR